MTFDLQKLDLKILAGGKKISDKSFKPFDDNVCEFIISLSGFIPGLLMIISEFKHLLLCLPISKLFLFQLGN